MKSNRKKWKVLHDVVCGALIVSGLVTGTGAAVGYMNAGIHQSRANNSLYEMQRYKELNSWKQIEETLNEEESEEEFLNWMRESEDPKGKALVEKYDNSCKEVEYANNVFYNSSLAGLGTLGVYLLSKGAEKVAKKCNLNIVNGIDQEMEQG